MRKATEIDVAVESLAYLNKSTLIVFYTHEDLFLKHLMHRENLQLSVNICTIRIFKTSTQKFWHKPKSSYT